MSKVKKIRFVSSLLLIIMMAVPTVSMAAQPTVKLGTASTFAVLAGSAISNTGPTTISGSAGGDIGLSPENLSSITGVNLITMSGGAVHAAPDAVALKAKNDLVTAYNDAAGRTPVTTIASELGGTTLKPGTYDSSDGKFGITGTLTLDAENDPNAVFVFKTAETLITASGSSVNLIKNAQSCKVFWQVGSAATLGTNSNFVGHILALTSITATTGAKVKGQLLARNGAVTLDTNTITNDNCETTAVKPTVTGGKLPKTSTHLYDLILLGGALTLIGAVGWRRSRKRFV
ncbi:MAG TPA: ice-binding family protein [Desulfosporosinus sp.]|nr:ice-binding family protein [Desulfosporosinus sp.]